MIKPPASRRPLRGFSLVELMVAVTIGLVVTLIIFNVLIDSETRKRVTTGVNDINQSGAYSAYVLDRSIRSAGSGFSNQLSYTGDPRGIEGCALSVRRGATTLLPAASAFPAPFAGVTQTPVLAPVIIDQGGANASDVITVMSGASGMSEVGAEATVPTPPLSSVDVTSTIGLRRNDIVLFAHAPTAGPCAVSQVSGSSTNNPTTPGNLDTERLVSPTSVALGGTYTTGTPLNGILGSDVAISLGNATTNPPSLRMYGVDARQQLVSYDLLNLDSAPLSVTTPVAEGVIAMRALYGVDTDDNNVLDSWQAPSCPGTWCSTTLRNGTTTSSQSLRRIVAVRVALVLRTAQIERDVIAAPTTFDLFSDLGLTSTVTAPGADAARYRYRVIETTIPLRNNLL